MPLRLASLLLLTSLPALAPALTHVDNFVLLDHRGDAHELYYDKGAAAVVVMIQGNGCPIVRNAWPAFSEIRDRYAAHGVRFLMLNANLQDHRGSIADEARLYGYDVPILDDDTQLVAESLDVIRTGEVFVIDPSNWSLAYRGPIDDRLSYERQKPAASEHYLRDTLDAMLAGEPVPAARRDAVGCLVYLDARDPKHEPEAISYAETIAPMLLENCARCHRPGGIGPWAMTGYPMIRGFAPMIREVVRTQRMPPWHADPHVGVFVGDRGLSVDERRTLVHWIEAGAPRGSGPDPLAAVGPDTADWPLGEPDLIIDIPPFTVPATGVVDYQFPVVANPLDRDVWVRAIAVQPGEPSVVHHALAGTKENIDSNDDVDDVFENFLGTYVPGAEPIRYPDNTGVRIPKGGAFVFQMHYTPSGREVTDRSRLALYFHDDPPRHFLRYTVVVDPTIAIPPGDPAFTESAYIEFDKPALIYHLFPHAHYRGRSSAFVLQHPDGSRETLLSVPKYDFNWQHTYEFTEPKEIAAGSLLIHTTVYDNSANNFANPDPARTVPWGLQSHDEMLYGGVSYRWLDETTERPTHDRDRSRLRQGWGYLDRDMDRFVTPPEMPPGMRKRWDDGTLRRADANGDGRLSFREYAAFRKAARP